MLQERIAQVRAKVAALIARYEAGHPGQKVPQIDIRFDLRGRSAGQAGRRGWNYFMRFNTDMMQNQSWDHLINDTVPHELAHVICFANGSDRGHGMFWRRTCQWLGGSGNTYHKEAVTYAKGETYVYTTSTGHTVHLSATRHRKVQQGVSYRFRDGKGSINRTSAYSLLGDKPVQIVAPTVKPVVREVQAGSKAELVRAVIRRVRAQGGNEQQAQMLAVRELGLTPSYARNCVKFNWGRV